jgi:hypothetical protein
MKLASISCVSSISWFLLLRSHGNFIVMRQCSAGVGCRPAAFRAGPCQSSIAHIHILKLLQGRTNGRDAFQIDLRVRNSIWTPANRLFGRKERLDNEKTFRAENNRSGREIIDCFGKNIDPEAKGIIPGVRGIDPGVAGIDPGAGGIDPGARGTFPESGESIVFQKKSIKRLPDRIGRTSEAQMPGFQDRPARFQGLGASADCPKQEHKKGKQTESLISTRILVGHKKAQKSQKNNDFNVSLFWDPLCLLRYFAAILFLFGCSHAVPGHLWFNSSCLYSF